MKLMLPGQEMSGMAEGEDMENVWDLRDLALGRAQLSRTAVATETHLDLAALDTHDFCLLQFLIRLNYSVRLSAHQPINLMGFHLVSCDRSVEWVSARYIYFPRPIKGYIIYFN